MIPGQQVRGQKRSGERSTEGVEYTQPGEERIPAPSLIPAPVKPPKQGWWQKRKVRQAAKKAQREADRALLAAKRVAQAKAQALIHPAVRPTPPPRPNRPLAVDVNLLPHKPPVHPQAPVVRPIPPATPSHVQAEPDFLSDAGFRSNSKNALPASEAYSIRRTKRPTSSYPVKTKEHPKPKHSARHEPVGEPAELLDVNLIPKEFGQTERPKHTFIELIWYGLTAALVVGAVYGGLQWWEFNLTQRSSELQQQVALLDGQIADYAAERQTASELQTKLQGLSTVISQHVTYDQFFSFLEQNTLPSVYYKSINVDSRTGQITASAVTADFEQLRAQEAVFQAHPMVKDVVITSATRTIPTTPTTEEEEVVVEGATYPLLFNLSLSVETLLFHP